MHSSWSVGYLLSDIGVVFDTRIGLEQAGYFGFGFGPAIPARLTDYCWYTVRNEYAFAVYSENPFCWIHDDPAEHIKEVAKWA